MKPRRWGRAAVVLTTAIILWLAPWYPKGLSETTVAEARFLSTLPEVNLPADRVLAVLREIGKRVTVDVVTFEIATEVTAAIPETRRVNVSQVMAIAEARSDHADSLDASRELGRQAWRLCIIFAATIAMILLDVMPIFVCALGGLAVALLTGVLSTTQAFSGFSNSTIILIVVAFAIAEGVDRSGLGRRIAYHIISRFGNSTLGLGYSLAVTDWLIAPAFPSNTARSGVIYPVTMSVARSAGSSPEDGTRKKLGAYLMMNGIAGLSISSATWFTAMAANSVGVDLATNVAPELNLGFARWFVLASVPSIVALIAIPYFLYRVFPPEVRDTPEAPEAARSELERMGHMSRDEWITAFVFAGLILLWALSKVLGTHNTAVAIAGLFVLMMTRVISLDDIRKSNGPITFVWFAVLYTMSTYLDRFGFMEWVGEGVGSAITGWSWPVVYAVLIVVYVLIHYFFVSQTAHMVAVFPIFLAVGINAGVPAELMAMMLLMATNFFSTITPQASSANAIFVGSEYITPGEVYRYGGLVTMANALIYGLIGTAWMWMLISK